MTVIKFALHKISNTVLKLESTHKIHYIHPDCHNYIGNLLYLKFPFWSSYLVYAIFVLKCVLALWY